MSKESHSLLLILFLFLSACTEKGVTLEEKSQNQFDIAYLRMLYSSGDSSQWPAPHVDSLILANGFEDIGHLPQVPFPADNPYSKEKHELGKLLFHDPRLSSSGQIACASCHDIQLGWGDGKRVAYGHNRKVGKRNAMTLWNVAFYDKLFWDGRAHSLEHQATMPVQDPVEMHNELSIATENIAEIKEYKPYFAQAFGDSMVSQDRIFKAIATFERKIVSPKSRFDMFIDGRNDRMTDDEVWGLHLFRTKARCINCHNTGLFSDNQFHNDGQTLYHSSNEDLGLYNITQKAEDVGKFKTPSLREVMNTGPWMHHGNFPTIEDVIFFYDRGNPVGSSYRGEENDPLRPHNSPHLQKLNLSDTEIKQLKAFLQSITTIPRRMKAPDLPGAE